MKQLLLNKIENREIVVGVIGLGYVGLPLVPIPSRSSVDTAPLIAAAVPTFINTGV